MKTEYLLQKEVDLVLAVLTDRNRLIMRTCIHTGLRIGDVLKLVTTQLKGHFWITETKTGKKRQVGLPEPLLSDLEGREACGQGFPAAAERWAALRMKGLRSRTCKGVRRYRASETSVKP